MGVTESKGGGMFIVICACDGMDIDEPFADQITERDGNLCEYEL